MNVVEDVEGPFITNELRRAHHAIKNLLSEPTSTLSTIRRAYGNFV